MLEPNGGVQVAAAVTLNFGRTTQIEKLAHLQRIVERRLECSVAFLTPPQNSARKERQKQHWWQQRDAEVQTCDDNPFVFSPVNRSKQRIKPDKAQPERNTPRERTHDVK